MCITESKKGGFTIIEFLVAMGIGTLALAAAATLAIYTARTFAAMGNYMELDKNSRSTLDKMTQLIRESDGLTAYDQHAITLSYHGGTLSFTHSPTQKTLTMTGTNGVTTTLLTDCSFLDFQIFQRNPISGNYDQYPATLDDSLAKIVQVSWICSRHLLGNLFNTESVQSAKVVIRKQ